MTPCKQTQCKHYVEYEYTEEGALGFNSGKVQMISVADMKAKRHRAAYQPTDICPMCKHFVAFDLCTDTPKKSAPKNTVKKKGK